jgi:hypothetical protein
MAVSPSWDGLTAGPSGVHERLANWLLLKTLKEETRQISGVSSARRYQRRE